MNRLSIKSAILSCVMLGPSLCGTEIPADTVVIRFVDPEGRTVSNVGVGTRGIGRTIGQSPWAFGFSDSIKAVSDANGIAVLDYRASQAGKNISLYALQSGQHLAGTWELPGTVFGNFVTLELQPARRVTGCATCSVWQERGLPVARTWIEVRQGGRAAACFSAHPEFEFFLPAGSYQLEIEGQKLFPKTVVLEVAPSSKELAIGIIDMAPTKLGSLFGMPAPELDSIKDWVQGPPVRLADLRGQHMLLHFCRWDRWGPRQDDLLRVMEICDAFDEKHLKVVILINYLTLVEEFRPRLEKMEETVGRALPCAIGVDADNSESLTVYVIIQTP